MSAISQQDAKPHSKEYEELRDDFLRQLASQPRNAGATSPNTVATHYLVQTGSPLPELDTQFGKAYVAQDERDPTRSLYALVCSNQMPVRDNVIQALKSATVPHVVTLHAAAPAELSGVAGRCMVLVHDRPRGKSLSAILAERPRTYPESFIVEQIVAPIGAAIEYFAEQGISHGRINPANIFLGETLTLGECVSEPCGYSQPYLFEPPDRAQALPAGKGESIPANDMFSLGVLAAYLCLGPRLFEKSASQEQHILRMLHDGSYGALTMNIEFSDVMTDLLRGTLNDKPQERWTWTQLKPWCKGRRYNMLPPSAPVNAARSFILNKNEFANPRALSHGLYSHWEEAVRPLQDNSLIRWMDLSARRKDLSEILRRALTSLGGNVAMRSVHQNDELIARVITILDPQAPLSLREVRTTPSGIGTMMAEGLRLNMPQYMQRSLEIIEQGLPTVWGDMYKRRDEELPADVANALWQLDRMRALLRIPGYGFGVERVLYDLCPDLPCQSPLMGDNHAATLKDMLIALDRVAADKAREGPPFDRHIAGFIGSKLNLARESHLSEYNHIPKLNKQQSFIALRMLEQAQEKAGKPRLPALSAWISLELLNALELFHSKSVRKQLRGGVKQLVDSGQLGQISSFINQRPFASSDLDGYREAIEAYFKMSTEIAELRNKREQKRKAGISGYAVAKYIAHIGFVLMAFFVMKDHAFR